MISTSHLRLADLPEATDLAAFLARLLSFDRAAVVRLQAVPGGPESPAEAGGGVLAVFGRLPLGGSGVLAVRTARLAELPAAADSTVSAGQLLDAVDEETGRLAVPAPVTGPAWAGLLPPRGGWRPVAEPSAAEVFPELMAAVREFKARSAEVPEHHRTRPVLDTLADEIWSRPVSTVPDLPLRAAHAAYVIGFLKPDVALTVHRSGRWLRLSTPTGSVLLREAAGPGAGLGLSPLAR